MPSPCNFIKCRLRNRWFCVHLAKILRTPDSCNTLQWLLLKLWSPWWTRWTYLKDVWKTVFTDLLKWLFCRSRPPEMFLGKVVLNTCSKCTGEHSHRSVISIKLQSNSIEITLWYGCSPVNMIHIFRTHFPKNIFGGLHLVLLILNWIITQFNVSMIWFDVCCT